MTIVAPDPDATRMLNVVADFTDSHEHWAQPHWAEGACFFASMCLLDDFLQAGVEAQLYETGMPKNIERPTDYGGHYFIVVKDWAIDYTARQFWPSAHFPVLQPLAEYRERFDYVQPSEDV